VGAVAQTKRHELILKKLKNRSTLKLPYSLWAILMWNPNSEVITEAKTVYQDAKEKADSSLGP